MSTDQEPAGGEEAAAKSLHQTLGDLANSWDVMYQGHGPFDLAIRLAADKLREILAAHPAPDLLDNATVERAAEKMPHDPGCFLRYSDGNCACKHLRLVRAGVVKKLVRVLVIAGWVSPGAWVAGVLAKTLSGGNPFAALFGGAHDVVTALLGANWVAGALVVVAGFVLLRRAWNRALAASMTAACISTVMPMLIASVPKVILVLQAFPGSHTGYPI